LSSGNLLVEGLNVKEEGRKILSLISLIGVDSQENKLDPDLNILENLIVYTRYFRIPKETAQKRFDELLGFIRQEAHSQCKSRASFRWYKKATANYPRSSSPTQNFIA